MDCLKIIKLEISGMRKIDALSLNLNPDGVTEIVGPNRQGKTSVLDALMLLFRGDTHIHPQMIGHGKEEMEVKATLSNGHIVKKVVKKGEAGKITSRLVIQNEEGMEAKSPQTVLNTWINDIALRPQKFIEKNPTDKVKMLLETLGISLDDLNNDIGRLREERRDVGRRAKDLGSLQEPERVDPVNISELLSKRREIEEANHKKRQQHQQMVEEARAYNQKQEDLVRERREMEAKIDELRNQIGAIQDKLNDTPKPNEKRKAIPDEPLLESTEEIDRKVEQAEEINAKAREYEGYLEKEKRKKELVSEYESYTSELKKKEREKIERLKSANLDIEGLEIREEGIYIQDVFSEDWSGQEKMQYALEFCRAMNPKLKVICIDNGETWDKDNRKALYDWAKKNDIEVVITVVDAIPTNLEDDKIYIYDGQMVST